MSDRKSSPSRDPGRVMMSAHALCPTEMPHPERMRWMANYFNEHGGSPAAAEAEHWRELCQRLYVELFHCNQQMNSSKDESGDPLWTRGPAVTNVLQDAKRTLEAKSATGTANGRAPSAADHAEAVLYCGLVMNWLRKARLPLDGSATQLERLQLVMATLEGIAPACVEPLPDVENDPVFRNIFDALCRDADLEFEEHKDYGPHYVAMVDYMNGRLGGLPQAAKVIAGSERWVAVPKGWMLVPTDRTVAPKVFTKMELGAMQLFANPGFSPSKWEGNHTALVRSIIAGAAAHQAQFPESFAEELGAVPVPVTTAKDGQ